jgi:hypothetical protein
VELEETRSARQDPRRDRQLPLYLKDQTLWGEGNANEQ